MSEADFNRKLSRLQALVATKNAQVMADPLRYLNEMQRQCCELRKVLDDVKRALSPDCVFDFAEEMNMRPGNINGEALIRCNKAKNILDDYVYGKNKT